MTPRHQTGDHAGQRCVHAGGDDEQGHWPQLIQPFQQTPQTGDTHIIDLQAGGAMVMERTDGFPADRDIRRAGGDHGDLGRRLQFRHGTVKGGPRNRFIVQARAAAQAGRSIAPVRDGSATDL